MLYPIFPRSNPRNDTCVFWEGFLTPEEINLLLAQPEWLSLETAGIGGASQTSGVNPEIRSSNVAWLGMKSEISHVWDKLSRAVAEVNSQFFNFDLSGFHEPMQLGVYSEKNKDHYAWHTDFSPSDRNVPRKLSMSMLLSDPSEFEGGEFQVKPSSDEAITLECVKGRAWFFPSYTLHRVAPVTKGVRRSLVLWIGGPPFK